jgi:hypothetical protein
MVFSLKGGGLGSCGTVVGKRRNRCLFRFDRSQISTHPPPVTVVGAVIDMFMFCTPFFYNFCHDFSLNMN